MSRPSILEFQRRIGDLTLAHGTDPKSAERIRREGFVGEYHYFCCGQEGWEMPKHQGETKHILVPGGAVASRCYPDPEGQWGPGWSSMEEAVEDIGLELVLAMLEDAFSGELLDWDDPLDPRNYNLVVIGPIAAGLIIKELVYQSWCQGCCSQVSPTMMTTYTTDGNCERCGHFSRLAIIKKEEVGR